jgi:hypothetical protein
MGLLFIDDPLGLVGLGAKDAHEAKVSIHLAEVETVADDEGVGDLEPDVVDRNLHQPAGRLIEQ